MICKQRLAPSFWKSCVAEREQGRPERELLDEAVKSYLERPGSLAKLFEDIDRRQRERSVAPLSEDEAMRLAVEEQHAWRRERRSTG